MSRRADGTGTWQLVNNLSALVGLVLVTLSFTYLFQVVSAVAAERSVMSRIAALGPSPEEAVAAALRTPDLGTLPWQLVTAADAVSTAAQQHLALPMLQFFHSREASSAVAVNLARLDEVLSLLHHALPAPHEPVVRAGRLAVDGILTTLRLGPRHGTGEVPPLPSLDRLRAHADEVADDDAFAARMAGEADRRERLLHYVRQEGWDWSDVTAGHG